MSKNKTERGK